jgi:hypothetical protein
MKPVQFQVENPPPVHLYRGAPPVRSWSRYKITDHDWALCGVSEPARARVDAEAVTCQFCLQLMTPSHGRTPLPGRK